MDGYFMTLVFVIDFWSSSGWHDDSKQESFEQEQIVRNLFWLKIQLVLRLSAFIIYKNVFILYAMNSQGQCLFHTTSQ